MSLSGDQTRLAWGSGTQYTGQQQSVFEVKLSPTYSFVPGSFKQYYLPNPTHASFVAGVEYAGRSIYASTWDGIYFIPNYGSTASLIPGSTNLTHQPLSQMEGSQLQYVESTSKIVGVRVTNTPANTGSLFSLDPSNNTTATIMSNPLKSGALSFGYGQAFTLPELIK
jgi:hypothetical protein